VLWVVERGVVEQRSDCCQARVAGANAVAALVLEVIEERTDQRRVEIADIQVARWRAAVLGGEAKKQPDRVAVGGDCVLTGVALVDQTVGEERLWRRLHRRSYPNTQTMRSRSKKTPQRAMSIVIGSS